MPFTKEEIEAARARWPGMILTDDQAEKLKDELRQAVQKKTMEISNVNQLIAFLSWVLAKHGNVMVIGEYGADIEVTYHDGLEVEEPAVLIKEVIRG